MGISSIGCVGHLCFDCGDRLNCSIYQSYSKSAAEVERLRKLCARRPKDVAEVSHDYHLWANEVDAAGRGEGE